MKIANFILGVLAELKEAGAIKTYTYQSLSRVNLDLDDMETPSAIMLCVTDRSVNVAKQNAKETAQLKMFFVTRQPNIDFDGRANDELVDQMTSVAYALIERIRKEEEFKISDDTIRLQTIFDAHDSNVTGVAMEFKMTEAQGVCIARETTWWSWDSTGYIHNDDSSLVKTNLDE